MGFGVNALFSRNVVKGFNVSAQLYSAYFIIIIIIIIIEKPFISSKPNNVDVYR